MHTPGHIRCAFDELAGGTDVLGEQLFYNEDAQEQWERMGVEGQLQALAGWVWYSTDIMPNCVCDNLDMLRGSTYGEAARLIRER